MQLIVPHLGTSQSSFNTTGVQWISPRPGNHLHNHAITPAVPGPSPYFNKDKFRVKIRFQLQDEVTLGLLQVKDLPFGRSGWTHFPINLVNPNIDRRNPHMQYLQKIFLRNISAGLSSILLNTGTSWLFLKHGKESFYMCQTS